MSRDGRFYQLIFSAGILGLVVLVILATGLLHGFTATWSWITAHPSLSFFLLAATISFFPAYREGEETLRRLWKETSKVTLLITLASFFVYYRSFVVTPSGPVEALLYNFGGRVWYLTGLLLILNLLGLPVASHLMNDD